MDRLTKIRIHIHRRRYQRKPMTFREIALEVADRFGDGTYTFSPGQLSLILLRKWDPEPEHIRKAYKLGPRACTACGHKHQTRRAKPASRELTPSERWWKSLKPEQRRFYIQTIYENDGVI